jgi:hypothetical protein
VAHVPLPMPSDPRGGVQGWRIVGDHWGSLRPEALVLHPSDGAGPHLRPPGAMAPESMPSPLDVAVTTAAASPFPRTGRMHINMRCFDGQVVDPGPKRPDAAEGRPLHRHPIDPEESG